MDFATDKLNLATLIVTNVNIDDTIISIKTVTHNSQVK